MIRETLRKDWPAYLAGLTPWALIVAIAFLYSADPRRVDEVLAKVPVWAPSVLSLGLVALAAGVVVWSACHRRRGDDALVVERPSESDDGVVVYPRPRLRVIRGALDDMGDETERVWPDRDPTPGAAA